MLQHLWFTLTMQDATATCTHGVNPEIALLINVQRYPRCIQHIKPKFHLTLSTSRLMHDQITVSQQSLPSHKHR